MLKWAFSAQGTAEAPTPNDDQVEATEDNQVPDIEKPWDPSAPSPLHAFKRREREAKKRWKVSRPVRETRENEIPQPAGGLISRAPPNILNQILDSIDRVLSTLGAVQRATCADDQQEIFSHMVSATQEMKQVRHLFNQNWRQNWEECHSKLNPLMDELNAVMANPGISIEELRVAGAHCGQVLIYMKRKIEPIRSRAMSTSEDRAAIYGYERFDRRRGTMDRLQAPRNYPQPQPPPVVPCYTRPDDYLGPPPPVMRRQGRRSPIPRPQGMFFDDMYRSLSLEDLSLGELTPKTMPPPFAEPPPKPPHPLQPNWRHSSPP